MDDELFVKLRDCFTAGYTLPQYCIDNGIKNPLFVSEKKYELFLWEVHVQFKYDRRLQAGFCFINDEEAKLKFVGHQGLIGGLNIKGFSSMNLDQFDKIILLTSTKLSITSNKIISLKDLQESFIKRTYVEIPLLNFLQRYPQVKLIITKFPSSIGRYKGGLEFNKQLLSLDGMRNILRKDKSGNVKTPFDKFGYTNYEALELMEAPGIIRNLDGSTVQEDTDENSLQKIQNGKRVTAYQPEHYLNKIYIVGSCHDYGINAPFDKTIASYLQKMLNEANLPYRVENESQRYFYRYQDIFYNLNKLKPASGDIIFVWISNITTKNFMCLDTSNAFDPPNDYREVFCVRGHVNELGYKLVAEKYFKFLTENNFFRDIEFNYPIPPPVSQIWYTSLGRKRRRKIFCQRRIGKRARSL